MNQRLKLGGAAAAAMAFTLWLWRSGRIAVKHAPYKPGPMESYQIRTDQEGGTIYDLNRNQAKGCTYFTDDGVERWLKIGAPCDGAESSLPDDVWRFLRSSALAGELE